MFDNKMHRIMQFYPLYYIFHADFSKSCLPISGKIDNMRRTELRKHKDPRPLNCHDLRCLEDALFNQLGVNCGNDILLENNGRPKLDGRDVRNCCDDATASPLSSEIGIIILIYTR